MVANVKFSALSGKTGVICDAIERRLAEGHYRFGEEISTSELVKEFQASRAPVTAALNYLRADGYLIITPQVGCKVISPSLSDIEDFFFVYGKVEGAMTALAAKRHTDVELEQLQDLQKQIKRATPKKNEKITRTFVSLVAEFHHTIHTMSRSELQARRADSYWRMSEFFLFNGIHMGATGGVALGVADKQREEIVEAIANQDAQLACRLMEEHMQGKPKRVGARGAD